MSYLHLRRDDRIEIYVMSQDDFKVSEIAKKLKKHKSTIYRELRRNADPVMKYVPDTAHQISLKRKKHRKSSFSNPLRETLVRNLLREGFSPEAISGRLKLEKSPLALSHETIYNFIYSAQGKKECLSTYLYRRRTRRFKLNERKRRSREPLGRISIHERPKEIATKNEFGHFECDLTFAEGNGSENLLVMIEKKSSLVRLVKNPSKRASDTAYALKEALSSFPFKAKSITFDRGGEFYCDEMLKKMGIDSYYCDPGSPWQKGQVESLIATARRYIHKKLKISSITASMLKRAETRLNNLPRKRFSYRTPWEVFTGLINPIVALQT